MLRNLKEFIDVLKKEGEIHIVKSEVDPQLEITEIYDRIVKQQGPALYFEKVKGSKFPLAINLFGLFSNPLPN